MPIPSSINELSTNPAANSPDGTSEGPGTLDNYQRAHAAFIAQLRDGQAALNAEVQPVARGGTGATTAALARAALDVRADSMATARVLGRTTAGTGAVEEISIGANMTLAAGVLSAVDGVPPGAVTDFARNTAPSGWLKANGALVSRTTFSALFAAIGTTWGAGDGSTTFALPDLRGEVIRGWDDGRGVDSGRGFGSAQSSQNLSHSHTASSGTVSNDHTHSGTTAAAGGHTHGTTNNVFQSGSGHGVGTGGNATIGAVPLAAVGDHTHSFTTGGISANHTHAITVNADGGSEVRVRNIALLVCIKF